MAERSGRSSICDVSRREHGTFAYVVVGAGTAGCIVAARLAERGYSVALLEAGGDYRRVLDVPLIGLWAWLRNPDRYCWNQYTMPQHQLDGRRVWFPGGRLTGGSSAINAMIYTRGHPASYDSWGVPGWRFDDLLPYHRRVERHELGANAFHGGGGPIGVSNSRHPFALGDAFIRGCADIGVEPNADFNGERSDGAGYYALTQYRGLRSVPAKGHLALARDSENFHHETQAFVTRVVFDRGRAIGVTFTRDGEERAFRATAEVILCAGSVRTPQLLMLSGVGPADSLQRLGIHVTADSAGTGEGLQDQVRVPVAFRTRSGSPTRLDRLVVEGVRYVTSRSGLLASNVCDVAAIARTSTCEVPDVRVVLRWRVLPETRLRLVDLEVATLAPRSRGRVALRSADPVEAPDIDPGYLTEQSDRDALQRGITLARRIASTPSMREAGITAEYAPGDVPVEQHVRRHAASAYHPVGTCRMGVDDASVVDERLRVRGVEGLRVVDASVIPSCVSANAQASVMAVAERGADLLLS